MLPAPEERNVADSPYSSPATLRSAGARVLGFITPVYKHSAPPEPACYWSRPLAALCNPSVPHRERRVRYFLDRLGGKPEKRWHPSSGVRTILYGRPEVSASLRPPATFSQPCRLCLHAGDECPNASIPVETNRDLISAQLGSAAWAGLHSLPVGPCHPNDSRSPHLVRAVRARWVSTVVSMPD